MTDFQKDIFVGLIFLTGIYGFISGAFIISTLLFGTATIVSTTFANRRTQD
ncbi:MAG: hypothetical protein ACU83N_16835 [Gammaproteobacteria bacterium]